MHRPSSKSVAALRAARKAEGLSQKVLSDRSGLTQAQISRFESGKANPRLSSLVELARGVGAEVMLVPAGRGTRAR